MILFILRFILFSGLFFLAYRIFFSRTSFFKLNRFVLLLLPLISILVPLIAPSFSSPFNVTGTLNILLPEVSISGTIYEQPASSMSSFNWWWLIYVTGAAVVFGYLIVGLFKVWLIIRSSSHAFENIRFSPVAPGPFAFFQTVIIPEALSESQGLSALIAHEKAHAAQLHSADNLYYNILTAFFWFNPFMHLLQAELRQTHECLADEAAMNQSNPESYSRLLLSSVFGSELSFDPANRFFNSSLIKTRITMIYKSKTKPIMKGFYLVLVPLIAIMSIASCQKTENVAYPEEEEQKVALDFSAADQPPLFENCDANASKDDQIQCFQQGILKHISENFKYPKLAYDEVLEGRIFVKFVISNAGKVTEVEVVKANFPEDANPLAVQEAKQTAIDVLTSCPDMTPGLKDGKKVAVSFVVPIMMKLE